MNKFLTAIVAILTISFLFSCNSNNETKVVNPVKKDFVFTAHVDTSITVQVPVTGPINLCAGGQSPYRKIKSFKDSVIYLSKGETITLTSDEMNSKGWYWFPAGVTPTLPASSDDATTISTTKESSNNSSFSWMPDWLQWLLEKLWQLALLALAAFIVFWLLRELVRAIQRSNNTPAVNEEHAAAANTNNTNLRQPTVLTQEVNLDNAVTVVNEGDKQRPLFVIKNEGEGNVTVGNIHIHLKGDGDQIDVQGEKLATEDPK